MFGADCLLSSIYKYKPKSNVAIFPNSRANNSSCSGQIGPMIEFIQILLDINILTKFGADWSVFADDRLCVNKVKYNIFFKYRADNSDHSVPIRLIIELVQDLTVTYIKTMFGTNWSTFAVARV